MKSLLTAYIYYLTTLFAWRTIIGVDSLYILLRQSTSITLYLSYDYKKYLLVLVCLVANWWISGWLGFHLFSSNFLYRLGGGPMVNLTLSYSNWLLFIVFMHVNGLYQHSMHINSYHMALPIYSSILPRSFAIPWGQGSLPDDKFKLHLSLHEF